MKHPLTFLAALLPAALHAAEAAPASLARESAPAANLLNMPKVWTPAVSGTRDWMRVETTFQANAATDLEINCLFGGWGSSTGQARYDDAALEPVAEPHEEPRATVMIDTGAPSVLYSPMIFGGFLEHFNSQIYGGVFEPGSPLSDKNGFRQDVLAALKELKVPIVRWPGGCYVSGYHWETGLGKERKPTDDMAWGVVEPNTFGTDEYVELCRLLGWSPTSATTRATAPWRTLSEPNLNPPSIRPHTAHNQ